MQPVSAVIEQSGFLPGVFTNATQQPLNPLTHVEFFVRSISIFNQTRSLAVLRSRTHFPLIGSSCVMGFSLFGQTAYLKIAVTPFYR